MAPGVAAPARLQKMTDFYYIPIILALGYSRLVGLRQKADALRLAFDMGWRALGGGVQRLD